MDEIEVHAHAAPLGRLDGEQSQRETGAFPRGGELGRAAVVLTHGAGGARWHCAQKRHVLRAQVQQAPGGVQSDDVGAAVDRELIDHRRCSARQRDGEFQYGACVLSRGTAAFILACPSASIVPIVTRA